MQEKSSKNVNFPLEYQFENLDYFQFRKKATNFRHIRYVDSIVYHQDAFFWFLKFFFNLKPIQTVQGVNCN